MVARIEPPAARSGASALDVARRCVFEGGDLALGRFGARQQVSSKGRGNVVTNTDVEVEQLVHRILGDEFPGCAILSEETAAGTDPTRGWVWVLDPIDGTKNYSMAIPFWCITIALLHDGEPMLGVTRDAMRDEVFWSVRGGGAWLDDQRITASTAPDVASSVIGMDIGYDDTRGAAQLALMGRIFPRVQTIRVLGSAALGFAYAAAGRVDMFTHTNVAPWDIAAGILLVHESGGSAIDASGAPMRITSTAFAAGGRSVVDDFAQRYGVAAG